MSEIYRKLGSLLKLERERQKIELVKISEELKISAENLEKVEEGDPKSLPSELYYNLFAKSYAEMLGIDFNATLEAIREDLGVLPDLSADDRESESRKVSDKKEHKEEDTEDRGEEETADKPPRFFKRALNIFLLICAAFVIIFAAQLLFFDEEGADLQLHSETSTPVETTHSEMEPETASELENFNWNIPEREAPSPLSLKVVAREESWATILADGDTAVFRNLVPWREYNLEASYRFVISIAHPSVVEVHLNGRKVDLRDGESRRISRVRINQVNYHEFPDATAEPPRSTRSTPVQVTEDEEPADSAPVSTQVYGPRLDSPAPDTQSSAADSTQPDTTVPNEEA